MFTEWYGRKEYVPRYSCTAVLGYPESPREGDTLWESPLYHDDTEEAGQEMAAVKSLLVLVGVTIITEEEYDMAVDAYVKRLYPEENANV